MGLTGGTHALGPGSGPLLVMTSRTGLGARAGHDLTIEATRWHGSVAVDAADPAESSVTVDVEVDSLEVREGTGGLKPLTDADRAEIKKTLQEILRATQYPVIAFRSTRVQRSAESVTVDGDLTIVGVSRPISLQSRLSDSGVRGSTTLLQTSWGIRPYSAFFGALKLSDEVRVQFDLTLAPSS